jgi:O-antigen/teichoic acid export membrane protein
VVLFVPCLAALLVGAPYLLRILGAQYATHGTALLRYVALALPFMAVNVLYVTYARLARRVRRVLAIQVGIAATVLVLTVLLLGPFGIAGAGLAFLIGQAAASVVVFPSVFRQYRRPGMLPHHAAGAALVARATNPVSPAGAPRERAAVGVVGQRLGRWPRGRKTAT